MLQQHSIPPFVLDLSNSIIRRRRTFVPREIFTKEFVVRLTRVGLTRHEHGGSTAGIDHHRGIEGMVPVWIVMTKRSGRFKGTRSVRGPKVGLVRALGDVDFRLYVGEVDRLLHRRSVVEVGDRSDVFSQDVYLSSRRLRCNGK